MKKTQLETHISKLVLDLLLLHRHRWLRRQTRLELKVQPRSSSTTRLKGAEAAHPEIYKGFIHVFIDFDVLFNPFPNVMSTCQETKTNISKVRKMNQKPVKTHQNVSR